MPAAVVAVAAAVAGGAVSAGLVASVGVIAAGAIGAAVSVGVAFAGSQVIGGQVRPRNPASQLNLSSTGGGRTEMVRQPITTCKLVYGRAAVSGPWVFIHSRSASGSKKNEYFYYVLPLAAHRCSGFVRHYLGDTEVVLNEAGEATNEPWCKNGQRYVWIKTHLGADDQAADQMLMDETDGKWTSAHRMRGICYVVIKLKYDADVFPSGIPKYRAVLDGKNDILDPRTGTAGWTDNAILCIRDYMVLPAVRGGLGAPAGNLDAAVAIAGANVCDEDVPLAAGGSEKRYRLWGVVDTGDTPRAILEDMLSACGGHLLPPGEKWRLFPAAYAAPTATIDESDLRGVMRVRPRRSRSGLFNAVKGVFISPDHDWQPTDYAPVTSATYQAQDNGEEIWDDFPQPFTPSNTQAQRLAKIRLNRQRAQISVDMEGKLTLWRLDLWEVAAVSNALLAWAGQALRCTDRMLTEDYGVDVALVEESPDIYAWSVADETGIQAAPGLSLPDVRDMAAPTNLQCRLEMYRTQPGVGSKLKAVVSWSPVEDGFVYRYDFEFSRDGGEWQAREVRQLTTVDVLDVGPGSYVFRVRAVNLVLVKSAWTTLPQDLEWLADGPPAPPTLYRQGNWVYWTYPFDPIDFDNTFQARILAGKTKNWAKGADWPSAGAVIKDRKLDITDIGTGVMTLMVKAMDIFGNLSEDTAFLTMGLGEYAPANLIASSDEKAAGFPGTVTNGSVDGSGDLVADDDGELYLPDPDALYLPVVDDPYLEVSYQAMSYEWAYRPEATDVPGSAYLESAIAGDGWSISYRRRGSQEEYLGNDDELYLPDGDALYLGGPTAWAPFPGSIDVAREAVDFRVTTDSGSRRGTISALSVNIDVEDVTEDFEDVVILATGTRLPITRNYRVIKFIGAITQQYDGYGATGVEWLDKDPALGPLGRAVGGSQITIDIKGMKGN